MPKGYYLPESRRGVTQISLPANFSLTPGFSPVNPPLCGKIVSTVFCVGEEAVETANTFLPDKHPDEAGGHREGGWAGHHFFLLAASAARQRNHAAVVACGRQRSPNLSRSLGFGISRFLYAMRKPVRTPKSSAGKTFSRPS